MPHLTDALQQSIARRLTQSRRLRHLKVLLERHGIFEASPPITLPTNLQLTAYIRTPRVRRVLDLPTPHYSRFSIDITLAQPLRTHDAAQTLTQTAERVCQSLQGWSPNTPDWYATLLMDTDDPLSPIVLQGSRDLLTLALRFTAIEGYSR